MKNIMIIKHFGYKQWRIIHDHELIVIAIYYKKNVLTQIYPQKNGIEKKKLNKFGLCLCCELVVIDQLMKGEID